ncbi:MAG: three-Cys-motif partner protein TcmP, partial [Nitrospirae bacterium]|nr:three-Cys-motif partner protein TcmP [Nitrospirota bacterium]
INFSVMDANMNVLLGDPSKARKEDIERMNAFWGDESWKDVTYRSEPNLFGDMRTEKIDDFTRLADEYRKRLQSTAGFKHVAKPILMRNKNNGPLYYLYFASQKEVAGNIIRDIFKKYSTHKLK